MTRGLLVFVLSAGFAAGAAPKAAQAVENAPPPVAHLTFSFVQDVKQTGNGEYRGFTDPAPKVKGRGRLEVASGDQVPSSFTEDAIEQSDGGSDKPRAGAPVAIDANVHRTGTITVDVLRRQPDRGLVVSVKEQVESKNPAGACGNFGESTTNCRAIGSASQALPSMTCIIYGDTSLICDPPQSLTSEEYALLNVLGSDFVDASKIDQQGRWTIDLETAAMTKTANYQERAASSGLLTIDGTVSITQKKVKDTANVTYSIGYDLANARPTSVDEHAIEKRGDGEGLITATSHVTLTFVP